MLYVNPCNIAVRSFSSYKLYMYYKSKIILLVIFISHLLSFDITGSKIELKFDSDFLNDRSIDTLLNFEEIGFKISDIWERNKFYHAVSYSFNEQISDLKFRLGTTEYKLKNFIYKYEEKLNKVHYKFVSNDPKFDYKYRATPFEQRGIDSDVYYKEALTMRSQYI